jgi:hypothetical protein
MVNSSLRPLGSLSQALGGLVRVAAQVVSNSNTPPRSHKQGGQDEVAMHHVSVFEHVLRRMQRTLLRVPISESSSRGSVPLDIDVVRSSGASNLTRCPPLNFELASPKFLPLPFPPPPPPINLNLNRTHHICYCLIVALLSRDGPAALKARLYH